jgi:type III secretion protein N (ATPase)
MKPGRVIEGEVHDARALARGLVDEARAEASRLRAEAQAEITTVQNDAGALAGRLLDDARAEAERVRARAEAEVAKLRDDARRLAEHLVDEARQRRLRTDALSIDDGTTVARSSRESGAHARLPSPAVSAAESSAPGGRGGDARSAVGPADRDDRGRVAEVVGLVVRARVPGIVLGELVRIDRRGRPPVTAEVVGFRGDDALLLPLGELAGVAPDSEVWRTGAPLTIACGDDLLGRVLDGVGAPIDDGPPLTGEAWPVDRPAPSPLGRPPITAPLPTGVRVIDGLLTLGRGQRVGLFAAAGVGKSTLLCQIARGAEADVIVVCQVGERGRELAELLADLAPARGRIVAVTATSDAPPLCRLRAVHVATAIAEWFRERRGASVLLVCDSLTRVARAQREVGLSVGEPPARHGYPPSVFALLPRLIERAGATAAGAITAIYTVLVAGDDHDEPIADEVRGLVDGHVVLARRLAQRGHFPPIDVVASVSRVMARVIDPTHASAAARLRELLATYDEHRDLITLGAYQPGRDQAVDAAIAAAGPLERFVRQAAEERGGWDETLAMVERLALRH